MEMQLLQSLLDAIPSNSDMLLFAVYFWRNPYTYWGGLNDNGIGHVTQRVERSVFMLRYAWT